MSQGIFKATEKLEDMVEGITPKTDAHHGFIAIETGNGKTQPLDQRSNSTRYFEIKTPTERAQYGLSGLKDVQRVTGIKTYSSSGNIDVDIAVYAYKAT